MDRYDMMNSASGENQVDGYKVDRDGCMVRIDNSVSASKTAKPNANYEQTNRKEISDKLKSSKTDTLKSKVIYEKPAKHKKSNVKPTGFFENLGRVIDTLLEILL